MVSGRSVTRLGAALVATVVMAACAGSTAQNAQSDPNAVVTVWTDATRQSGFNTFATEFPKTKLKIELYNAADLYTKLNLFNVAGSGWPDVIAGPPAAADPFYKFAAPLDTSVPADVQKGFGTANGPCTFAGHLYCLTNDVAQEVLWYDSKTMAQFGYSIPTTWEDYEKLGLQVAKEHPGYVLGSAGDTFVYWDYLMPSGCPIQNVTGPNAVHIDMTDVKCTRVASMVDTLVAAGALSKNGLFSPEYTALAKARKVLMQPAPAWFAEFVIKPAASYGWPSGVVAAAPLPKWQADAKAYTGNSGGISYIVSKHAKNLDGAVQVAQWMATSPDYQTTAPTYPAYQPAAAGWSVARESDPYYAANPVPVLQQSYALISPVNVNNTRYNAEAAFTTVVVPAIHAGQPLTGVLPALQTELVNLAKAAGYTVN